MSQANSSRMCSSRLTCSSLLSCSRTSEESGFAESFPACLSLCRYDYSMSVAPAGREGAFGAFAAAPLFLGKFFTGPQLLSLC